MSEKSVIILCPSLKKDAMVIVFYWVLLSSAKQNFRSCCQRCSIKNLFLKTLQYLQETYVLGSLLINLQAILLKVLAPFSIEDFPYFLSDECSLQKYFLETICKKAVLKINNAIFGKLPIVSHALLVLVLIFACYLFLPETVWSQYPHSSFHCFLSKHLSWYL